MALSGPWFNAAVVRELEIEPRPTAVVSEATTWEAFPALWRTLLDEVWEAVRGHELVRPGRNVMLYKDDVPNVEVGVEAAAPFSAVGRVVGSVLPGGRVLTATHRGPFEEVGATHAAVIRACDERGLRRLGPRWEIYGHWDESDPKPEVEVYYLVA
jgi:effector-binding domain-containing protein